MLHINIETPIACSTRICIIKKDEHYTCLGRAAGDFGLLPSNLLVFTAGFVSLDGFLPPCDDSENDLHTVDQKTISTYH